MTRSAREEAFRLGAFFFFFFFAGLFIPFYHLLGRLHYTVFPTCCDVLPRCGASWVLLAGILFAFVKTF